MHGYLDIPRIHQQGKYVWRVGMRWLGNNINRNQGLI